MNNKKEQLLKELHDVNSNYFYKVQDGECFHDSIGEDNHHLFLALRYVPNTVIKKWIKKMKKEIKKQERLNQIK